MWSDGDGDDERRAPTFSLAEAAHRSPVQLDDVTDDRATRAKTAVPPRGGAVLLTEAVGPEGKEGRIDARAGVRDRDAQARVVALDANGNSPVSWRERDRLRHQIPDRLLQARGTAPVRLAGPPRVDIA